MAAFRASLSRNASESFDIGSGDMARRLVAHRVTGKPQVRAAKPSNCEAAMSLRDDPPGLSDRRMISAGAFLPDNVHRHVLLGRGIFDDVADDLGALLAGHRHITARRLPM